MEKPGKCISRSDAQKLSAEWWATRGKPIETAVKHKEVCAVNFTIKELEEYLAYVKENSKDVNEPGISIWMGTYPEDYSKVPEKMRGSSTVFLSPTKSKTSGTYGDDENDFEENEDIEPFNNGSGIWPPGLY